MTNQMWFGIPGKHMQWVPCPSIDSSIQRNRYVERIQFEHGGGDGRRSSAYQMEYQFVFNGLAHELEGIDVFNKFASGFFGDGLIELAHPANFETNMFSAAWASPGIIEQGWKNIYKTTPTFSNTASNAYGQPSRSATWNVSTAVNTAYKKFTIAVPPTHTLYIGASGSATGSAVLQVKPILADNTYSTPVNLTLLDPAGSTRMNTTFSGATYSAVEVYITRTSDAASTITLTSMMAQLYKNNTTPQLPTRHYQGEGSTGLMFADEAVVETYTYLYPPRKGIATTLIEVGAWRNGN